MTDNWKWHSPELEWLNELWKKERFTPERNEKAEILSKLTMEQLVFGDMHDDACKLMFGNKDWKSGPLYNTFISAGNRAKKFTNDLTLTIVQWRYILSIFEYKCLCCGSTENITMDHIVPLSKGGGHSMKNVQPLCSSCNSAKGTKCIDYRRGIGNDDFPV